MKLRAGVALEETTVLIRYLTVQDLLQKNNGARKLEKYFQEFRIGYINAEGKQRINQKVFEEINYAVRVMKMENVSKRAPIITEIEAMDEEEFDQFQLLVSQMVATILQAKKTITSNPTKTKETTVFSSENYLLEVELQLSAVITKLLRQFGEAARKEESRNEEAYKNRVFKEAQLNEQIKVQSIKKWDLLLARLKADILIYVHKSADSKLEKLDFSLLHPKNMLGNVTPVA
ncbi:MAG: hypothetical protein WC222_07435 [Parachlamydiales bacterium]|jgi:hypothetical protein